MTETRETGETGAAKCLVSLVFPFFLVFLALAATWKLTLGGRIIARGDLLLYFYPLRDFASQAIREGRLPLWNPYTFMGAPFLANSQVGFFYPFNVITAWLPVEQAVSWNIALHLVIAVLGAYALAVLGFKLDRSASFATGVAFGLGGYLGAQAEHFNQLQALAWLPLMVLTILSPIPFLVPILGTGITGDFRFSIAGLLKRVAALTLLIALQVTAGHTQSLYVSLVTLGIVLATQAVLTLVQNRSAINVALLLRISAPLLIVIIAGVLAALLTAIQLLPTLELSRESARAGGLSFNEAGSFSWRPWVIVRALMPTYGDPLFPEYIAYFGAAGLALAVFGGLGIGDWRLQRESPISNPQSLIPLVLTLAGFVLALGAVTPLFNALYRFLPGFNLFRAQARWLVVFALGMSLLIGLGVQRLRNGLTAKQARNWLIAWLALLGLLVVGLLAGARISPEPEYASLPVRSVLIGWAVAVVIVTAGIIGYWLLAIRAPVSLANSPLPVALFAVVALSAEMLAASQFQPYSRAADRQALTSLRPSTAHLLAEYQLDLSPGLRSAPLRGPSASLSGRGERVLALSSLFFDPGDKVEQEMIYNQLLSVDEVYDRIIASKHKEILSPNLSLYYRLPSVDGYDGGLLPTRRYAEFVTPFAQTPMGSVDGRLREFLRGLPDNNWLDQMAVRYVIADKTQDVFVDGVYYDLLFSEPISEALRLPLTPYTSTGLGLVMSADGAQAGDMVATAQVTFDDGSAQLFDIRAAEPITPYFTTRLDWGEPRIPITVALQALEAPGARIILRGLTSIDATDGSFLSQMVMGDHAMRLVHSGDVKIYENLKSAPRAFIKEVGDSRLEIVDASPEHSTVNLPSPISHPSTLVIRDACYPGWVARVDGVETPIECADVMFRSVNLPVGAQSVEFSYAPQSARVGAALSLIGLCILLALIVIVLWANKKVAPRAT